MVIGATLMMQMGLLHVGVSGAIGASHSCPTFNAVSYSEIQGRRWTFDDRIYDIRAQGVGCPDARKLILRAHHALNRRGAGLGVFIRVDQWQCTSYRPFTGSAGFIHWNSACKRQGSRKLTWSERTLRSRQSNSASSRGSQLSTFAASSALVKLYADELGHRPIRALDTLVVSALARVEVPAALWRKTRSGELDDAAASILVSAFELDFHGDPDFDSRFTIVAPTEPVLITAAHETARHALRAYDAVQLASALAVREIDPRCDRFACFDTELRRAAGRAGFLLVPEAD